MEDYKLEKIVDLIDKVRPSTNDEKNDRLADYLRLSALFVYFQYAVASVRMQEGNIKNMVGGQHRNFTTHEEYADCLLKLYSSAITAYSNIRTSLNFSYAIIKDVPESLQDKDFKTFRNQNRLWVKNVVDKRDRVTAHPEEKDKIVWKPNMWSDNGQVRFRAINPKCPESSCQIILEPRSDLEKLRLYLLELAHHLERLWNLT